MPPTYKNNQEISVNLFQKSTVIQADRRDDLQKKLTKRKVETKIHYPVPIHLQETASYLGYKQGDFPIAIRQVQRIFSLPVYPELKPKQLECAVNVMCEFFEG
jgi:dTDP-4-amino-4,6-dideoxygalactose transaminase